MYTIAQLGDMIGDRARLRAYAEALRATVRPGSVVVDIGTGTGIMALLACHYGARRVYAIEPSDSIEVAREAARANGFGDRIAFLQRRSTEVTLEEAGDVLVSDMRGVLPPWQRHFLDIADARTRFLAPGGRMVPRRDSLFAAVVEAPTLWRSQLRPWQTAPYGLDLTSAVRLVTNNWRRARFPRRSLLTEPRRWATVDYRRVTEGRVTGHVKACVLRAGTGHGLALWFDADLAPGAKFSNAPGAPPLIYGQAFFPWPEPVGFGRGDLVRVSLRADPAGEDYVWSWETSARRRRRPPLRFRQSTFLGTPFSKEMLAKRATTHRARLSPEGRATRAALNAMDGKRSLSEVVTKLQASLPQSFRSRAEALAFVAEISTRFSQ